MHAAPATGPIVFFDGVCGLCNASVDRVLRWDRRGVFRLAPLQGETAARELSSEETQQLGSVVLKTDGRIYRKSTAVVRILWRLGLAARLGGSLLWLIPRPLRDFGYDVVAKNRYRWFGKKETCRMPKPEERDRFLP
jgi:predicted DCC family thiol-disulfide oxidoreductase YuxK